MEFKNGDRVKALGDRPESHIGTVVDDYSGTSDWVEVCYEDWKNGWGQGDSHWNTHKSDLELFNSIVSKKELLAMPIGTKITTDSKEDNVYIKIDENDFENEDGDVISEYDIEEDLSLNDDDYGTRIVKIEEPTYSTIYNYSKEIKEMTIAEIEKKLGHAVKIIKEGDND